MARKNVEDYEKSVRVNKNVKYMEDNVNSRAWISRFGVSHPLCNMQFEKRYKNTYHNRKQRKMKKIGKCKYLQCDVEDEKPCKGFKKT